MSQPKTAEEAVAQYFRAQTEQAAVISLFQNSLAQATKTIEEQKEVIVKQVQEIAALKGEGKPAKK